MGLEIEAGLVQPLAADSVELVEQQAVVVAAARVVAVGLVVAERAAAVEPRRVVGQAGADVTVVRAAAQRLPAIEVSLD